MQCKKARFLMSAYIDDDLDARRSFALERHLAGCSECRKVREDLSRIVAAAERTGDPHPPEEAWMKIQSRISRSPAAVSARTRIRSFRAPSGFRFAAAAATLILAFTGGLLLGPGFLQRGRGTIDFSNSSEYTLSKLEEAESHYLKAIKALAEAVESGDGQLDPQLAEVFQSNLALINASIETCKQAVTNDPSDLESRKYLLAAYRDKTDLLTRIMNINGGPSRTGKDTTL